MVAWAKRQWPGLPVWLAGFSFGGFIAIKASGILQPQRLVTVAPAISCFSDRIPDVSGADWLLIQGQDDDVVLAADMLSFVDRLDTPPSLALIEGAGHFFHGRLNDLKQVVLDAFGDG